MGWLRRPVVWVLLYALCALCALRAGGRLRPPAAARRAVELGVLARVAGPLREDLRGEKVVAVSGRYRFLVRLPRAPGQNALLRPGLLARLSGRLRPGRAPRNPGDFDEAAFLEDRGLSGVFEARACALEAGPAPPRWRLWSLAETARRGVQDSLRSRLAPDQARLMEGLMLGYKGALPRPLNAAFQDSGLMHLVVPSGAKVGLVLAACALLCAALPLGMGPRYALCAAAGGFYVVMVGAEPPYLRAYLTAVAYFGARLLGREPDAPQALVLSALAVLALDARAPFSAGFQMTYAAMAGLILVLPRLSGRSRIWSALWITVVVQAMLWPVFANVFGKGSLAAPLANLVCCPLATGLAAAGWLLAAGAPAGALVGAGVRLFERAVFFFASPSWASVALAPMSPAAIAGYYLGAAALLMSASKKVRALSACAGLSLWLGGAALSRLSEPLLRVVYLSQPRGRVAALVFFRGRDPWLVGAAPSSLLARALAAEGAARLDRIVSPRDFLACAGAVCCGFDPPRAARRLGENDILASRLRTSAVEVTTDGSRIEVRAFRRKADQLGRALL